jgi:hypothetical protein
MLVAHRTKTIICEACIDLEVSEGNGPVTPIRGNYSNVRVLPAPTNEGPEYGIEVSNKVGVRAYAKYGGVNVAFERSPKELRDWAEKSGLVEQKAKKAG